MDLYIFNFLNNIAGQSSYWDMVIVFFASDMAYILIAAFLLFLVFSNHGVRKKLQISLVVMSSAVFARFIVTEIIRFIYDRPRPFVFNEVNQLVFRDGFGAFPSGHTTFFFAMSTALYFYNKKLGTVFLAVSTLMAVGRVVAGVHWPSDILAGVIIGVASALGVFYYARKLKIA